MHPIVKRGGRADESGYCAQGLTPVPNRKKCGSAIRRNIKYYFAIWPVVQEFRAIPAGYYLIQLTVDKWNGLDMIVLTLDDVPAREHSWGGFDLTSSLHSLQKRKC